MLISIALKDMCKLHLVESSPKNSNNDSLSHVIDDYVWKMWNENNLKVWQWMFSLLQCRMKNKAIDEEIWKSIYVKRVALAIANQTLDINCINGNAFHSSSWWSKRSWSGRSNMAFIARLRQWRWDNKDYSD